MGAEVNHASDLKRLQFVRTYTGYCWDRTSGLAGYVYNSGKAYAQQIPTIDSRLSTFEGTVTSYSNPLLEAVQTNGDKALKLVDAKVDGAVLVLSDVLDRQREFHAKNVTWFNSAKDLYLKRIDQATGFLKENGLQGTALYAADVVMQRVEEAKKIPSALSQESKQLVAKVSDAWQKLAAHPAVNNVVEPAQTGVDFAWKKYISAHDAIAASDVYHKAFDVGTNALSKVQETSLYRTAAVKLYPMVSPYMDPALDKVTHSPYYNAVVDHLKPLPTNGAAKPVEAVTE